MLKPLLLCGIFLGWGALGFAQSEWQNLSINSNYSETNFIEFCQQLEKSHNLQFYFFSGWVADLKVKQTTVPSTLGDILQLTFSETDYDYFIHPNGQIILTYEKPIQGQMKMQLPRRIPSLGSSIISKPNGS